MGRIPQIHYPPGPKRLSAPSVGGPGFGDCPRHPEERSRISRDRVHRVRKCGRGSRNFSISSAELCPALSHRRSTRCGLPSCRYSVLGLQCSVWRCWCVWQPIDPVWKPFVPVWPPSSPVQLCVRLSTGLGVQAVFPTSTGLSRNV